MTHRFLTGSLPLLALAAVLAMQAKASSIVSDGGFESAALGNYTGSIGDGWTVTAGTITVVGTDTVFGISHSGNQMVYLDFEASVNTISQTLTTVVGQSYTISYWLADTSPNTVIVTFGGQTLFNGTSPTNGIDSASDYVQYTFTATATSTSTVLSITGQWLDTGASGTLLDDVSVTPNGPPPTPAPSSLYLCLIGLAGLAWYAARSAKRHQIV